METFIRIELQHPESLPSFERHVAAHECESLRLHLLRVPEDNDLLRPVDHWENRRKINLRCLIHHHNVKQLRFARKETSHVVGRHDPVSYTHLRAHETVLDLVCRLLLEK